jgi:hypothetical protein
VQGAVALAQLVNAALEICLEIQPIKLGGGTLRGGMEQAIALQVTPLLAYSLQLMLQQEMAQPQNPPHQGRNQRHQRRIENQLN